MCVYVLLCVFLLLQGFLLFMFELHAGAESFWTDPINPDKYSLAPHPSALFLYI